MKKIFVVLIAAGIAVACHKKSVPAATTKAETPAEIKPAPVESKGKLNMGYLAEGKKTYEANCGRCHSLKNPEDYSQEGWVKWVDRMAPKARLTEDEKAHVLAYVRMNAKDAPKDRM